MTFLTDYTLWLLPLLAGAAGGLLVLAILVATWCYSKRLEAADKQDKELAE